MTSSHHPLAATTPRRTPPRKKPRERPRRKEKERKEQQTLPTYVNIPRAAPQRKVPYQRNYAGAPTQEPTSSPAQVHQGNKENLQQ